MQLMVELPAVISKEAKQIFYINSEQTVTKDGVRPSLTSFYQNPCNFRVEHANMITSHNINVYLWVIRKEKLQETIIL